MRRRRRLRSPPVVKRNNNKIREREREREKGIKGKGVGRERLGRFRNQPKKIHEAESRTTLDCYGVGNILGMNKWALTGIVKKYYGQ